MTLNSKELLAAAVALILTFRRTGLPSSNPAYRSAHTLNLAPSQSGLHFELLTQEPGLETLYSIDFDLKKQSFVCKAQNEADAQEAALIQSTIDWRYSLVKTSFADWLANVEDYSSTERLNYAVASAVTSLGDEPLALTLEYSATIPSKVEKLWFTGPDLQGVISPAPLDEVSVALAYSRTSAGGSDIQEMTIPDVRGL